MVQAKYCWLAKMEKRSVKVGLQRLVQHYEDNKSSKYVIDKVAMKAGKCLTVESLLSYYSYLYSIELGWDM
jgi:hypothetical protein